MKNSSSLSRQGLSSNGGRNSVVPLTALEPEQASKTQRKRAMLALQALGERLVALPQPILDAVPMEERLREAIEMARGITQHEGRRRQLQYVGKLMRATDAAPIQAALDRLLHTDRMQTALLHAAERWRDRLINEPASIDVWLAQFGGDLRQLQPLVDASRAEITRGLRGRHFRELYRLLRARLEDHERTKGTAADPTDVDKPE